MDILIDATIDKPIFYKKLSDDKVINLIGESGSGKSSISINYKNDENYIVVDYDLLSLNPQVGTVEYELKQMLINKYGPSLFESVNKIGIDKVKENFTTMYHEIISFLSLSGKTIVLDGSQLRFIKDAKEIKGEFVALRPSLQTCISQSLKRFKEQNPNASEQEIQNYIQSKADVLHKLNPLLNDLLVQVDKIPDVRCIIQPFDIHQIQTYLSEKAVAYLNIIQNEYGQFMSKEQLNFMKQLLLSSHVVVEQDGDAYIHNQENIINHDSRLTSFQKLEEIRKLNLPLAHGGRVFEDNIIHFYPFILMDKNPKLTVNELRQKCDEILIHELLHYFIRPQSLDITNNLELKGINTFTTEGLVDMCARDIHQKYGLFPNYNSEYGTNVIFMREALSNILNASERMKLVFNGSVSQIYQQTSTPKYNSQKEFIQSRDKKTEYDHVIAAISSICFSEKKAQNAQRFLYNFSANFKSKNESLSAIEKMSQQQFNDKLPLIQQQINTYKNNNLKKTQISFSLFAETADKPNQSFTQRNQSEIQVYQQIKQKNKMIKQQKEKKQQHNKPQVRTLTQNSNSNSSNNKGLINVVILSLIISFACGALFMIAYAFIKR